MGKRSPRPTALFGALLALVVVPQARPAAAAEGALASVNVAATSIGDGVSTAVTGSFAYQLTSVVGFGVEAMWVPTLTPKVPDISALTAASTSLSPYLFPTPSIRLSPDGGRAVIVTPTSGCRSRRPAAASCLT